MSNNKTVKVKDLRQGVTIYIAQPVLGVVRCIVKDKKTFTKHSEPFFTAVKVTGHPYANHAFLPDCGIGEHRYDNRRSFFKRKHAERWLKEQMGGVRKAYNFDNYEGK